jgi:hypothetical protein
LLRSRSAVVVQLALDAAPDDLVRERIDLLIDPRATVRGAAQRRLTKIGTDVLGHYQECVAAPNAPAWAVVGLAETGGRRVAEQLVELMRHPSADVRRGALRAARWSLSGHALTSLAAVALHDESELVVRAAARVLRRDVPYVPRSVVTDLQASESRWLQVAGLRLARRSDSWTRLEAALRMAADADPALAREGRADLSGWHPHGIPTAEQRETVLVLVTSASLDAATERRIRFYCGRAP